VYGKDAEGERRIVEVLEECREHELAQLAPALANYEEWEARRE